MSRFFKKHLFSVFLFFILLTLTGCQPEQINSSDFTDTITSPDIDTNLNQKTFESCLADPSVDACIFWKNPVAQNQGPFPSGSDITDILRNLQTYGVHISNTLVQLVDSYTNQFRQPFRGEGYDQRYGFQDDNSIIKLEEVKVSDQDSIIIGLQPHGVSLLTGFANFPKQKSPDHKKGYVSHRDAVQSDESRVFLQNDSYDVTINYKGIERAFRQDDDSWKFEYGESNHSVVQVMTYYYLIYQMIWMQENAGGWYPVNENITVVALDEETKNNAYWSPLENTISLGFICDSNLPFQILKDITCDFKMEIGLSAEITLHEAGHANFYHAKKNQTLTSEDFCNYHTNCEGESICQNTNGDEKTPVCCSEVKGCFFAIDEGQADFHASVIFPESPQIGEAVLNDVDGLRCQSDSSIHRNPESNADKTASQIFYQCNQEVSGEVHNMGMLYSSIWWSLYTHPSANQQEIMNLFTNHLPLITSDDNFETAGHRILNLDQLLYSGKYSSIITSEFQKRGLTPQANVQAQAFNNKTNSIIGF